jgi:hypothetical protein
VAPCAGRCSRGSAGALDVIPKGCKKLDDPLRPLTIATQFHGLRLDLPEMSEELVVWDATKQETVDTGNVGRHIVNADHVPVFQEDAS